jgi:signal peptidase I
MAARLGRALTWVPVAIAADAVLGGPAIVPGVAMAPSLAAADVVLVDRLAVRLFTYGRGDVVVLR